MARLLVERRNRVLLLTLSDPATRNALHPDIYQAGIEALDAATEDSAIGAVVLTGEGGCFCSGGNLHRLAANREKERSVPFDSLTRFHDWVRALRRCPKPIIAAVEGVAAGAGFSIALACDLFVAARNARFIMAYVKVGLSPDGGASAFVMRSLPPQLAAEILLEGQALEAPRLHALGVVNELCDPGQALGTALARSARLAEGPAFAMGHIKRLLNAALNNDLAAQLDLEREAFLDSLYHPQCGEGIAAFLERRKPDFTQLD